MLDAGWQTFEALALRKTWADSGKIVLLSLRERLSELGTAIHLAERDEYFKLTHYPGCWMLDAGWQTFEALALRKTWADSGRLCSAETEIVRLSSVKRGKLRVWESRPSQARRGQTETMAKTSGMTTSERMAAPREIRELAEKFAEHRETYRRPGYNETQLRQDFLDPFFIELGWDVYNRQGFAEAYRDVILEQGLRVEASVRAPDYCFRVGGTPKFFVEAKKPAVDIKSDVGPAFQLRRYAWTAKIPHFDPPRQS
jgi:hypothetical protein